MMCVCVCVLASKSFISTIKICVTDHFAIIIIFIILQELKTSKKKKKK